MRASDVDEDASVDTSVQVNFVNADRLVPCPKEPIPTTDEGGRAPRNPGSRRIQFFDDGKLFEGHFTVHSHNLKSIIQHLLDRHNEQDVIIQDLQKQVHLLRTRQLKFGKHGNGADALARLSGTSNRGGGGSSDVNARLKRVEQFLQLWGVQLSDVAELVEEHGDPAITPDAYTSFLLDLPAFRLTRREARALMLEASQHPLSSVNAAVASDTAGRRRQSFAKREGSPGSGSTPSAAAATPSPPAADSGRKASESPERRGRKAVEVRDDLAETTLEKATAALEKAEMLLAELRSAPPRVGGAGGAGTAKSRRAEASQGGDKGSNGGGGIVDWEARSEIEELGDYVMRRFDELEAHSAMVAGAVARSSSFQQERGAAAAAARPAGGAARGKETGAKKSAVAASPPPPPPAPLPRATGTGGGRGMEEEVVDAIAREDAAASLDLLEELEVVMERRFKELSSAVANLAVRTAALSKGNDNASPAPSAHGGHSAQSSPAARRPTPRRENEESAEQDGGRGLMNASHTSSTSPAKIARPAIRKGPQGSPESTPLIPTSPVPGTAVAAGPTVDQTARDDTAALSDRVNDLEEELLDRWQAMEERLRIIGRAAMKQSITNATAGALGGGGVAARAATVDRKARDDAALSLVRVQQLEKELAALKRQWAAGGGGGAGKADIDNSNAYTSPGSAALASSAPSGPLRDTYGSKVADLEKEVEQRMAEVNHAIAQLRGVGGGGGAGNRTAAHFPIDFGAGADAKAGETGSRTAVVVPSHDSASSRESAAVQPSPPHDAALMPSQLTLRAEDGSVLASIEGSLPLHSSSEAGRRAARQSIMDVGYGVMDDIISASELSLHPRRPGERRVTVSRLRALDEPPYCSPLVQRTVLDLPADSVQAAMYDDSMVGQRTAATAATPIRVPHHLRASKGGDTTNSPTRRASLSVSSTPGVPRGGGASTARVRL